jgi:hypothetical protein
MVEELLEFFICEVDAKLLKAVKLQARGFRGRKTEETRKGYI